jgi:predicted nucleic acid-binding protein
MAMRCAVTRSTARATHAPRGRRTLNSGRRRAAAGGVGEEWMKRRGALARRRAAGDEGESSSTGDGTETSSSFANGSAGDYGAAAMDEAVTFEEENDGASNGVAGGFSTYPRDDGSPYQSLNGGSEPASTATAAYRNGDSASRGDEDEEVARRLFVAGGSYANSETSVEDAKRAMEQAEKEEQLRASINQRQRVAVEPTVPAGARSSANGSAPLDSDEYESDDSVPRVQAAPGEGWKGGGFDAPDGTIALPLSYYQILGISSARSTPNAIPRAAIAAVETQLPEGYSPRMMEARLSLIDEAVAVLKDEEARRQHDADIREGLLTPIEPHRAAAALCLLQEAGEYEAVLEFEHVVAQCMPGRRHRKDVALSAALALCEYGHMALMANPPRISEGCELLEMGSNTLDRAGGKSFAPEVRRNIDLTYHDVAPGYVLELLSAPLEEKAVRDLGLRALRTLLWTKDPSQQLEQRAAFMEQANELLTAEEQVSLFIEAPDYVPVDTDEVYKSALAHVVAGVMERKPMLIVDADEILHQLQVASLESENVTHLGDVAVERAVCQLLLGQLEEAAHTLGLYDGTVDPDLEQYIQDRSQAGDYVEGMCAMADQWLHDVAFPLFRGSEIYGTPSVEEWFAASNVQGFVNRFNTLPVLVRIQGAVEVGKRAVVSSVDSVLTAFAPTPPALQFGVSDARRRAIAVAKLGVFGAAAFAVSGKSVSVNVPKINPIAPFKTVATSAGSAISKVKVPTLSMPKIDMPKPKVDTPKPKPARAPPAPRAPPPVKMDKGQAEKIVRKWQTAKAQALGQSHNTRLLEGILEGPMLQQWKTRAEDVASHGWAWEYQLNHLGVDSVDVVGNEKIFIEVTLTEVAVLKDRARNEPDDIYESTYRAKYELRKSANGGGVQGWKIVGGSVVY